MTGSAWLDALRAQLKTAAAEGRPVSVGAARHSMGGQALVRAGVAMTFDVKPGAESWIEVDRAARTYRVAAGARWRQVIAALDPLGFSPRSDRGLRGLRRLRPAADLVARRRPPLTGGQVSRPAADRVPH